MLGSLRNSQGIYEPDQEARGLPGLEAYDQNGDLRFGSVTNGHGNQLRLVPFREIPEPHWMPDETRGTPEPRSEAWKRVKGRLCLSSPGFVAHPEPQHVGEVVRAKDQPCTDAQRVAGQIWLLEATWEEIEAGRAAERYTWRELVEWLHAMGCAGGRWRFAHARDLCSRATPEGQHKAHQRAPWHE